MNNALRNSIARPSLRAAVNSQDLVIDSGAATSLRPVQPGHCLNLVSASSQYVDSGLTVTGGTAVDISFTINPDSTFNGLLGCGGDINTNKGFLLNQVAGNISISSADGTTLFGSSFTGLTISSGAWYECRLVWDGGTSTPTLTVNGVDYVTAGTISGWAGASGENLKFGDASGAYFDGQLGFCKHAGFLQYNNDFSSGTSAIDSSGNGNDGTLVNGPTWTTDNSLPYSWLNQVGYSQRMHFDMSDDCVRLPDDAYNTESSGYFEADVITGSDVASGQAVFGVASSTASGEVLQLRIISGKIAIVEAGANIISGSTTLAANTKYTLKWESTGAAWKLYVGGVEETINVDAGSNTGGWFDGVTSGVTQYAIGCLRKSTGDTAFYGGSIYSASINDGASVISSYTGYGNTDADWTDQTGSNNGTVNGSPDIIYIPRDEATPANDSFGNPLQWSGSAFPRRPVYRGSYAGVFDGTDDYIDSGVATASDTYIEATIKKSATVNNKFIFGCNNAAGTNRVYIDDRTGAFRATIGTSSETLDTTGTTGEIYTLRLYTNGDFYKDGVLVGNTGGTMDVVEDVYFGARNDGGNDGTWWTGEMYSASVYSSGALTTYTLSEGVGSTVHDISGNGNDGTITNASTATEGAGFWAGRIDGEANAHNINNGFSLYESGANDLRVPYVSGAAHPSPTVPGGYTLTSQNPAVANSHNDAETTWDFENIGTGDTIAPETSHLSNFDAVTFSDTNYSLGTTSPIDSVFWRDKSGVLKDRATGYGATLTGAGLVYANNYTDGERWNNLAPWDDGNIWND